MAMIATATIISRTVAAALANFFLADSTHILRQQIRFQGYEKIGQLPVGILYREYLR
jgi:hypothetical protein